MTGWAASGGTYDAATGRAVCGCGAEIKIKMQRGSASQLKQHLATPRHKAHARAQGQTASINTGVWGPKLPPSVLFRKITGKGEETAL